MSDRPVALVTGASRGIGAAVARSLAPTHDLLLGGRDRDLLEDLADELPSARAWPVDLTSVSSDDVAAIASLDVLVHSAGVAFLGPLAEASVDVWRQTFEINLIAVASLTRLLLPALRAAHGHVVLINSGAGLQANPNWGVYAASKFALRAFGDSLRAEEQSIRVTSVHPGRVDTEMQRGVRAYEGGDYQPQFYLEPESVARAVVTAVEASADAHFTEIVVRPRPH